MTTTIRRRKTKQLQPGASRLLDLPPECLYEIFKRCQSDDLKNLSKTCKRLNKAVKNYKLNCRASYSYQLNDRRSKRNLKLNISGITCRSWILLTSILIIALSIAFLPIRLPSNRDGQPKDDQEPEKIQINLEYIDQLNNQYPGLLSEKQMRIIKTRLLVMVNQVSILMLLGRSRDSHCRLDPTFCVGQTIANATQMQFGYIDASDPDLHPQEIERELRTSLEGIRYTIMIDSLEKLPGSEVMNLFQYIDRDPSQGRRRGMLLFVVYMGQQYSSISQKISKMKEAQLAEMVLTERWSPYIPKDSLDSVISRLSSSIVKLF